MATKPISIRLDPSEIEYLDTLVARDRAKLESLGMIGEVNHATVLRAMIKQFREANAPKADPRQLDIPSPVATPSKATKKKASK